MPDSLTPGDGQEVLARFKHAREGRDPDAMLELFAEEAEYRSDPFEPPLMGAVAIRGYWNDVAASQSAVEFDAERSWVVARTVLASWHGAYTRQATAERVRQRGFCTMELDAEGHITRMRVWPAVRVVGMDRKHKLDDVRVAGEGQDG